MLFLIKFKFFHRHAILPSVNEEKDEDSDEETDTMDTEEENNSVSHRCIALLNSQAHVNSLVRIVERGGRAATASALAFSPLVVASAGYFHAEAVRNLCRVCHQLLMYNPQVAL